MAGGVGTPETTWRPYIASGGTHTHTPASCHHYSLPATSYHPLLVVSIHVSVTPSLHLQSPLLTNSSLSFHNGHTTHLLPCPLPILYSVTLSHTHTRSYTFSHPPPSTFICCSSFNEAYQQVSKCLFGSFFFFFVGFFFLNTHPEIFSSVPTHAATCLESTYTMWRHQPFSLATG